LKHSHFGGKRKRLKSNYRGKVAASLQFGKKLHLGEQQVHAEDSRTHQTATPISPRQFR